MPPKGKPKHVELYGVVHVGWRDALDFAYRLPKGRFDAFLLEAAFEDEKLKGWVDRKLRGTPSTASLTPVDVESDFFGYLNAQAHLIKEVYRSINRIINLEDVSPSYPHIPFSKYLSQKFVGVNEVREALAKEFNYMYNRDAKAWEIIKNAHFRRAIGWRGLYHLPFLFFISFGDNADVDLQLFYSNYFVNMRQQPIFSLTINPFFYEELISTRGIFGKKAASKDGSLLASLLIRGHHFHYLHRYYPFQEGFRLPRNLFQ